MTDATVRKTVATYDRLVARYGARQRGDARARRAEVVERWCHTCATQVRKPLGRCGSGRRPSVHERERGLWQTGLGRCYAQQSLERPNLRIDVQARMEPAETVVVRARACGIAAVAEKPQSKTVEWLACYRVRDELIREIRLLAPSDVVGG